MKIINGERASGKTDGLIFTAYATGAQIVAFCRKEADRIAERAHERGMNILPPICASDFVRTNRDGFRGLHTRPNYQTPIIIDEANMAVKDGKSIIEIALENLFQAPIIAVTMTVGEIKSVLPKTGSNAIEPAIYEHDPERFNQQINEIKKYMEKRE